MDASTRLAFNMKVLKRHDPAIEEIIDSVSYVVLYSLDVEWTKTGTEGPMFLYKRSIAPQYGFFVLNRNGVENYSAHLALEDDLEISDGFIIYRSVNGEDVVGIWIFEEEQRDNVGQQMLKLQKTPFEEGTPLAASIPDTIAPAEASTLQHGTPITLDALFGTTSLNTTSNAASISAAPPKSKGLSLLDSIFDSASADPKMKASPLNNSSQGADGLKAMLGLQNTFGPAHISSDTSKNPSNAAMHPSNGTERHSNVNAVDIVAASIQDRAGKGPEFSKSLSRRDFVREVLSLIHTDKEFVDDLYERYLAK